MVCVPLGADPQHAPLCLGPGTHSGLSEEMGRKSQSGSKVALGLWEPEGPRIRSSEPAMSGGPAVPKGFLEEPTGWPPRGKPGPEDDGSCLRARRVSAGDGARLGAPTEPVSRREGLVRGLHRPRGHRRGASFRTGEEGQGPEPAL